MIEDPIISVKEMMRQNQVDLDQSAFDQETEPGVSSSRLRHALKSEVQAKEPQEERYLVMLIGARHLIVKEFHN